MVSVRRGHVEVDDHADRTRVNIGVGQTATVDKVKTAGHIDVSGQGKLPKVLDANGKPVPSKPEKSSLKAKPPGKDKSDRPPKGKGNLGEHGNDDGKGDNSVDD